MILSVAMMLAMAEIPKDNLPTSNVEISIIHSEKHPDMETVEIVYKKCSSRFDIKLSDLQKALDDDSKVNSHSTVLDSMIDIATKRGNNGCK